MSRTREELSEEIEKILLVIREGIVGHGGDVSLVDADPESGVVHVRLSGACIGCPLSEVTLKEGIEEQLCALFPEVKRVLQVE